MSIEQKLVEIFEHNGYTWRIKDKGSITPDEDDMGAALDEAARLLYDEPVGAQLEVGRLIIVKKTRAFDIYAYVGEYQ